MGIRIIKIRNAFHVNVEGVLYEYNDVPNQPKRLYRVMYTRVSRGLECGNGKMLYGWQWYDSGFITHKRACDFLNRWYYSKLKVSF